MDDLFRALKIKSAQIRLVNVVPVKLRLAGQLLSNGHPYETACLMPDGQDKHSSGLPDTSSVGTLRTVQEILGHSQITTTQISTYIISERKRKALEALPY